MDKPGLEIQQGFHAVFYECVIVFVRSEETLWPRRGKELGIDRLSISDRITLVQEIWDSIAANPESVPLTVSRKLELDRRLDLEGYYSAYSRR